MRKSVVFFLVVALSTALTLTCHAINPEMAAQELILTNSNDFTEVKSILEDKGKVGRLINGINSTINLDTNELDAAKAFKVFRFKRHDIVQGYQESGSLVDLVSDEYTWVLPLNDVGIKIVIIKDPENNNWRISGVNNTLTGLKKVSPDIEYDLAKMANEIPLEQIDYLSFVKADMYFTEFILLANDDGEYVIPYGTGPDLTGLENGKVYDAKTAINILAENFAGENGNYDGGAGNNIGFKQSLVLLLIVGSFVSVYFLVRGKKAI